MITEEDLERYHRLARMLEDDWDEAFQTATCIFGSELAGAVLVAVLRQGLNDKKDQWPPPLDLKDKVKEFLTKKGLYEDHTHRSIH